jgi:NDP-sugar pyrophosphorylase family protein
VLNADAYLAGPLPPDFVDGWDRKRPRLLVVDAGSGRRDFDHWRFAGISLLPAATAARLRPEPTGLYEVVWRAAWAAGRLDLAPFGGAFVDCGTPADYLAANLHALATLPRPDHAGPPAAPTGTPAGSAGTAPAGNAGTAPPGNAVTATTDSAATSLIGAGAVVTGDATDSVIGAGAVVAGRIDRCVIWPGARVEAGENLTDAIRVDSALTVRAAGIAPGQGAV